MQGNDAVVLALVVVNDAAGEGDLAALAVDVVVGRDGVLVERRGVSDQLEDRAGLVDIADGVVAEQCRRGVAKVVGVEGGADGQGENLAGVHVLHDHGAVEGLGLLHGVIESLLGKELDVLVDGEDEIAAGLGVALAGAEHLAPGIDGGVHAAGHAVQLRVEFFFQTPESVVVYADVAEHLRGDLVVRIEALKLLLEVDALHVEGADAGGRIGADTAGDPGEVVSGGEAGGDLRLGGLRVFRIGVDQGGKGARGGGVVVDLGGVGVDGVDLNGHCQLAQVAVVEHAAARRDLEGALLLLLGAVDELAVADDLQPEEAGGDGAGPKEKEEADEPEARPL